MNFDFGEVLTKAWKITWKYKVLWIFGMLTSCGQGGNSSNFRSSYRQGQTPLNLEMTRQVEEFVRGIASWFSENPWMIAVLVGAILFLALLQIFLAATGGIGLVRGAYHADGEAASLPFGALFRESLRYFWRVVGLALTIGLPFVILFFAALFALVFLAIGLTGGDTGAMSGAIMLLVLGLCCCLVPVAIVLGVYYKQAERALLIEELGIFAAIRRGWQVFTSGLGPLAVIWFILLILGLVIGILISLPYFIALIPLMLDFMQGKIQSWRPFINAGILILCYYPIFWFLSGVLRAYTETVWTLAYLRLTRKPEEAVVVVSGTNA